MSDENKQENEGHEEHDVEAHRKYGHHHRNEEPTQKDEENDDAVEAHMKFGKHH